MAFDGMEMVIVVAIVAIIFIWGPQKIPEIAGAIGRARKEYEKASREVVSSVTAPETPSPQKNADDLLMDKAKQFGISTEGKSREQILNEIVSAKRA